MRSILAACIVAGIAAVVSGTAQARVDFDIGIGIPGYAVAPPPPPVYYQPAPVYVAPPAPVVVAPGYYDDWQARRAWQEQQWRERSGASADGGSGNGESAIANGTAGMTTTMTDRP